MLARAGAVALACAVALSIPAEAQAAVDPGDLGGIWKAVSLTQDEVGYTLNLVPLSGGTGTYAAVFQFRFQNGRLGKRLKYGLQAGATGWTLVDPKEAMGTPIVVGTFGQDGSIYFRNCQAFLPHVTRRDAPSMCLFQQQPTS